MAIIHPLELDLANQIFSHPFIFLAKHWKLNIKIWPFSLFFFSHTYGNWKPPISFQFQVFELSILLFEKKIAK
jgi:hypothetical protein